MQFQVLLHINNIGPNRRKIKNLINYLLFVGKSHVTEHSRVLLTITQGKFHQVKHMFPAEGNRVKRLHREKLTKSLGMLNWVSGVI
jgi:16S rRNA U516 pseudouridylate synthase RsuA-like enzyme